jgi:predicted glycosyltransferase
MKMKRILIYSHDTYGLGNIRRMLAVVEHLVKRDTEVCALILSGSPMMQAFRLSPRIDYIKLPCLTRTSNGDYKSKYLDVEYEKLIRLRADLILNTLLNFEPDLFLVDKKPLGVQNEVAPALDIISRRANRPRVALVTREILDSPEVTKSVWERNEYHSALAEHYDSVLVLGPKGLFDFAEEYAFPEASKKKIRYCGYIAKRPDLRPAAEVRRELQADDRPIVLLTAGGGRDGMHLLDIGIRSLLADCQLGKIHLVVVPGPEMEEEPRKALRDLGSPQAGLTIIDFTNDMMSYIAASDVVVSMAGYNTVTELLSLGVPGVLVPRVRPSQEQWIRATRLERLGLFTVIHPDQYSESTIKAAVDDVLATRHLNGKKCEIDMNGLQAVHDHVQALMAEHVTGGWKKLQLQNVAELDVRNKDPLAVTGMPTVATPGKP